MKKTETVYCHIQHGHHPIKINKYNKILGVRKFNFAPHLVWNDKKEKQSTKFGVKNIYAIGSSFLYLQKIHKIKKNKISGTIVFPYRKSSEVPSDNFYINELLNLVEKKYPGPYSICLGYDDYNDKYFVSKIKKRKWKIVCCGERTDRNFLYNLNTYIQSHKEIVVTFASTILLYSLYLKKKTYIEDRFIKKKKILYFHKIYFKYHKLVLNDLKECGLDIKNLNKKKIIKKQDYF